VLPRWRPCRCCCNNAVAFAPLCRPLDIAQAASTKLYSLEVLVEPPYGPYMPMNASAVIGDRDVLILMLEHGRCDGCIDGKQYSSRATDQLLSWRKSQRLRVSRHPERWRGCVSREWFDISQCKLLASVGLLRSNTFVSAAALTHAARSVWTDAFRLCLHLVQ
jgi:hypothetical protein